MSDRAEISRAEFEVIVRRAGLKLTEQQMTELLPAWRTLETLLERLRGPFPREAEPAFQFDVETGGR